MRTSAPRAATVAVALLAALALLATACSSTRRHRGSSSPSSISPTAPTTGVRTTTPGSDGGGTTTVPVKPAVEPVGAVADRSLRTADGRTRTYHVYLPSNLPEGEDVPLLVALHGGFGNGNQFRAQSGYDGLAEANGFIVAFPDGTPIRGLDDSRVWNAGGCCGAAAEDRDAVDDVAFIGAVIDDLEATLPVDRGRVFVTGHSNGAMMSFRLACELSDRIAAIGVQSGALFTSPCQPTQPVSVLQIHGTADDNVPIDGGKGGASLAGVSFPDPKQAAVTFARLDGCGEEPTTTTDPDNDDVTTRTWTACDGGTTVRFVTVAGANHAWMGHPSSRLTTSRLGPPYADFDSSLAIWTFLASVPSR